MYTNVSLQVFLLCEVLVTVGAPELSQSQVQLSVSVQVGLIGEPSLTDFTLIGLIACMFSHVVLQH